MPNVGRPSKGCKNCRDRKVKCDQKRPSCSQCIRAKKECHGYRDPLSMMFKNESVDVAKKAEKRYEELAKQKLPSPSSSKGTTPDFDFAEPGPFDDSWSPPQDDNQLVPYSRYATPDSMPRDVMPSITDQALGFFMGSYVAQPTIVPRGQFEWVAELLVQPGIEEILRSSVAAASLASFATATKSPVILEKAQAAYGTALRLTNNALHNKKTAVKDSTLISVIMLGMYENSVFDGMSSLDAWAKHVDGACALLKLRGKDQFKTSLGRRLFHQYYGTVLLVALQTGRKVHEGMHELYTEMTPMSDYSIHGRQWTTRLIDFMHEGINLNQDRTTDPKTMVGKFLEIDRELDAIKALMPHVWDFEVVHVDEPCKYLYGQTYFMHLDPWIAQMWNNIYSCRLCLYKNVREHLAKGYTQYNPPLFTQEEYESIKGPAEDIIRVTAKSIAATIPQITGMIPFPDTETAKRRAADPTLIEPSPIYKVQPPGTFFDPSQSTHMVHLLWPLYSAAQSDLAPTELRQWAIGILHFVALQIGTRQAVVLADDLKHIQRSAYRFHAFVDRSTLTGPPFPTGK